MNTHIGAEQNTFQFFKQRIIDFRVSKEQICHIGIEQGTGFGKSRFQLCQPTALRRGFLRRDRNRTFIRAKNTEQVESLGKFVNDTTF